MNPRALFETSLALIDRISSIVCRRAGLYDADAEDFASKVRIALMEDDYAILRQYGGRSSLPAYLAVVIRHLLADERTQALGRWRPSRATERLGQAAVLLETLMIRDGRSLDEALPLVRAADPALTCERAAELAATFPQRVRRPRIVELEDAVAGTLMATDSADAGALARDVRAMSERTGRVIREALSAMPLEDRMLLRFRFASERSIADISRMMRLPQRPLYRRLELLLARLRNALVDAGIEAGDVAELIGGAWGEIDFGLRDESHHDEQTTAEGGR